MGTQVRQRLLRQFSQALRSAWGVFAPQQPPCSLAKVVFRSRMLSHQRQQRQGFCLASLAAQPYGERVQRHQQHWFGLRGERHFQRFKERLGRLDADIWLSARVVRL